MTPRDMALAVAVAVVWGVAFVATEFALQSFTPPELTVIRFTLAALPVLFVRRPDIPWRTLIVLGTLLFALQFLLQFFAYNAGLPPGVASVAIHTQALFTVVIAALVLRERPTPKQIVGLAVAAFGLLLVGASVGNDLTVAGLGLAIAAALSWAIGNVMLKRLGKVDMLAMMIWLCIVPPLPALALSVLMGDNPNLIDSVREATIESLLAALYLGLISTAIGYTIWGRLLNTYKAVQVAPFALLAPCAGVLTSFLVFHETFGALRGAGMALIVVGIAVCVLGQRRAVTRTRERAP